jgi:hypothetical protein
MERATCLSCQKPSPWPAAYRCWDCDQVFCRDCVAHHFQPRHTPHPITLEQVYALLNELEGVFDEQTYDGKVLADFDRPDDAEHHIVITAGLERRVSKLLTQIERSNAQAIEAGTAETGTGSVHESAVPAGDAPVSRHDTPKES